MNDFTQQQDNNPTDDNAGSVPAFKIDLSGIKDRVQTNEPTIVGSTPEGGPITLDRKPEQEVVIDNKVEFGNEALQNIEQGKEVLKSEQIESSQESSNSANQNSSQVVQPKIENVTEQKTESKPIEQTQKEPLKYSGYPIEESLLSDVEKVKNEKGKGDANDGLTAILLFLDRLFRIRDKAK